MTHFRLAAVWFLALNFSTWLGRAEMHTDDTGILVGLIATGGFALALLEPRRPWIWGLVVPAGIIATNLWRRSSGVLAIAAFTIAVGCAAAYFGAFLRRQT
jgi:hypothetical protein